MFKNYYLYRLMNDMFFVEAEDLQEADTVLKLENMYSEDLEYVGMRSDIYAKSSGLRIYQVTYEDICSK